MDKTVEIDDALLRETRELTGEADERTAVERVLRSYVDARRGAQKSMFDLVGKVRLRDDYDHKALRVGDGDPDR